MNYNCAMISGIGLFREINQDNLYCNGIYREDIYSKELFRHTDYRKNTGLYAVADGMGGGVEGEVASLEAVRFLGRVEGLTDPQQFEEYLLECNNDICNYQKRKYGKNNRQMGTTFAGVSIYGETAVIANIGDSRIYQIRNGMLRQISRDHTTAQTLLDAGILTREEAEKHSSRHQLSQCLGIFSDEMVIQPFTAVICLEAGDGILLCSDGLAEGLDDQEIEAILRDCPEPETAVECLYQRAESNGTKDNITVLYIQIGED